MIEFETLLPEIMTRAPECPEPTAISAIRDAFTELCEECRCWKVEDDFMLEGREPEILFAPAGTLLIELDRVSHDGRLLRPITIEEAKHRRFVHDLDPLAEWRHTAGTPGYYTQRAPNELIILPHRGGELIRIEAYVKPGPTAEEGPDWAMNEYRLPLRDGALMRILDIPGQAFSNPRMAGVYASAWSAAKASSANKWVQGQQRAPLRTLAKFF